ncbi:MAG: monovalent cation/H(+) antiporter subunit G [Ottowia sp.]|nr:monovalent cation/H(+) antiporter subunit G [Ottowia sp.]
MMPAIPVWAEVIVAVLLLVSAVFVLGAAWGVVRMDSYFLRMHPPALVYTGATWSVCLASIIYFSMQNQALQLRAWVIVILLAITVPITTVLLSRAGLFRARTQGQRNSVPPPLHPVQGPPFPAEHDAGAHDG